MSDALTAANMFAFTLPHIAPLSNQIAGSCQKRSRGAIYSVAYLILYPLIHQLPHDLIAHQFRCAVEILAKGPQAEVHAWGALVQ